MLNEELPRWLDWGITLIVVAFFFFFLWFMKPIILHSEWKEKFYDNKVAWTLIILSIIAFLLMFALGVWVDTFFGVETYK